MASAGTRLHIGADTTEVGPVVLEIGSHRTAAQHFRHDPPTPLELENAIAAVEDEIARVHKRIARGSVLHTRDAVVREIALEAGLPPGAEMTFALDAVEQAFERLPLRAGEANRAAALLILRELMHHLGFAAIVVAPPVG